MEKINLLEQKIHKTINLINQLRQENRHLKEEIALREEEIKRSRKILKENETYREKIKEAKEHLNKLLEKFEKHKI
ncbi:MAG TPA: hypothetical protein DHV62_01385 [Elusimicrobia bacterium]|jgi:FtsZ-binding cell division protein ZapB|nr:hypothetical protein [Elusimicrobiota bacterium]